MGRVLDIPELLERIPQKEPFRFVETLHEIREDFVRGSHTWNPEADFYRGHFPGNPVTPGVLLVRRELVTNTVPDSVGGGTVAYVNPTQHLYLTDPEHREEAGTPAIVESIRAGLVFDLKDAVGVDVIQAREEDFVRRAIDSWSTNPTIEVLGNTDAQRLSITSFVVRRPNGRYLHHNFIVAVLNDLFGIQSRGGCSCAGPYGHRLLGIDVDRSHEFEREISQGCEGIKPGWTRINFNYFISESVFDYLVTAVHLVELDNADHADETDEADHAGGAGGLRGSTGLYCVRTGS